MNNPEQMNFFNSLDFPGRTVLYVWEIAEKLGGTVQHYLNLIDTGELVALDTACRDGGKTRRMLRVPVEAYRNFIVARLTGELRMQFLAQLPVTTRLELIAELKASLKKAGEPLAHR